MSPEEQPQRIRVGGSTIAVRQADGGEPTLVLCHANSMSSLVFGHQLQMLAGRYRVVAPDLPGHGESSPATDSADTCTVPGYAGVLIEVVRALGVTEAIYVGWSMGGHVILEAADRLPGMRGILLIGVPPIPCPPPPEAFLPNPALAVALRGDYTDEEAQAFAAACVRPGQSPPAFFLEDFHRADPTAREALATSLVPGGYKDEVEIVERLRCPLAIVHGAHDQLVNRAYIDRLTMPTLWRGAVQEIETSGHTPQWEDPEGFNALLEAFAADCM